jgi:hypothetical protein
MRRPITRIDSPGIEPVSPPREPAAIGGRADTWRLPVPREDDDRFEPIIIRGRD